MVLLQGCGGDDGPSASHAVAPPSSPAPISASALPAVPEAVALKLDTIEPTAGPEGASIALRGNGFTRGTRVRWGDTLLHTEFQSATQIAVTLPGTATDADVTHVVEAVREDGARAVSPASLTLEALPVRASLEKTDAQAGEIVRITGSGLHRVVQVDMNGDTANVIDTASDGSWLDVEVPEGGSDGTVELWDGQKRSYAVGYLKKTGSAPLPVTIEDVQIGQTHLYAVGRGQKHPYMRFVANKPTMVKVRLKPAPDAGKALPTVRLMAANSARGATWFDMKGPAELGASAVAQDDLANSYTLTLDPSWMQRGFRIRVEAHDKRSPARISRVSYTTGASVPRRTFMRVHVVNLVPDGTKPAAPSFAVLERALREQFPLSDVRLVKHPRQVRLRGKRFPGNEEAWLDALERERVASGGGSSDFFVGFSPVIGNGVGLTPGRASVLPATWNGADPVSSVMLHELGHNLGRDHTWEDRRFPYWRNGVRAKNALQEGALAGGPWRYYEGRMFSPTAFSDIMSYNEPSSISDFTYANILSQMPSDTRRRVGTDLAEAGAAGEPCDGMGCGDDAAMSLHVSGVLKDDGATAQLNPVVAIPVTSEAVALEASAPRGPAELEVRTAAGTFRFPLELAVIERRASPPATVFSVTVPAMRGIESIYVVRDGKAVVTALATPDAGTDASAPDKAAAGAVRTGWGSYRVDGRTLNLRWDARRYPWLSAWARVEGRTVPVAVAESGGTFASEIDASATAFIVTLSDGLNSEVHRIAR